jgi:uncharacterized protein (TIGR02266 family)
MLRATRGEAAMSERSRRIDVRIHCCLPVALSAGKRRQSVLTEDVGQRGVFLRTDTPPALRQLVHLDITLPDHQPPLSVHGMAVHVVATGGPRVPGVGVQFYAMDGAARARWAGFFGLLRTAAASEPPERAPAGPGEPLRRKHPRVEVALELELTSVDELVTLYTRDVSAGGMFIVTDLRLAAGARLAIEVHHPIDRATFSLEAVVRRHAAPGEPAGLGVEFVGMDDARRLTFLAFVTSAAPREAVDLVAEGDPALLLP